MQEVKIDKEKMEQRIFAAVNEFEKKHYLTVEHVSFVEVDPITELGKRKKIKAITTLT